MSQPLRTFFTKQKGLSLIELMIAMAVGLFITIMISALYINSKDSTRYQQEQSRLQENARTAMEKIGRSVRNAGFQECGSVTKYTNVLNGGATNWWLDLSSPIRGYDGSVPATFPTQFTTISPTPASGTDLLILVGTDDSDQVSILSHNASSAQINTNVHTIPKGTILVITDCSHTSVFQMTGPATSSPTNVVHNEGESVLPGNCYKGFGASCGAGEKAYTYQPGASIMRLAANAYYVGTSSDTTKGKSLWTLSLAINSSSNVSTSPVELVEGVDDMQIEYGEDTDSNGVPNRYVTANNVSSWPKVINVRLNLLMSTPEKNVISSSSQSVMFNGATTTYTDRRIRRVYTSTVTARNRTM
jgi:type IV pilus assembly protein PilW